MLLLLALLMYLSGMTLFSSGGSVPSSGTGDVLQAPAPARAQLAIKRVRPITIIVGSGFKSGEVVRLTGVNTRQVRASAGGTFTLRLRNTDPCNGFSVTAVGNKGSRAAINYSQLLCVAP
jgi:hypothetical protein